jgi:hypothetical protein
MSNNYIRTTVTLPRDVLKELRKFVPRGKYSEYTAEAVLERLAREKSWKFIEAFGRLTLRKGEPLSLTKKFLAGLEKMEEKEIKRVLSRK